MNTHLKVSHVVYPSKNYQQLSPSERVNQVNNLLLDERDKYRNSFIHAKGN